MKLRQICLAVAAASIAACSDQPAPKAPPPASPQLVGLPGKIVKTDGKSDIALLGSGTPDCRAPSPADADLVLRMTNAVRARHGQAGMTQDARLRIAAQEHACDMAGRGVMTHFGSDGSKPSARVRKQGFHPAVTAENIAAGRLGADRVAEEWAGSPGHLANIVLPGIDSFGLGRAVGADGKSLFWVAVYGAER